MVRKKSVAAKYKSRKAAYKRRVQAQSNVNRSWGVLYFTLKAVRKFLSFRHKNSVATCLSRRFVDTETGINHSSNLNVFNIVGGQCESSVLSLTKTKSDNINIIQDILKKIVSKVCRLESERKRQAKNYKKKLISKSLVNNESCISNKQKKKDWFKNKYYQDSEFQQKKNQQAKTYYQNKYQNNHIFRTKETKRIKSHILIKYYNNISFRTVNNSNACQRIFKKYHNNSEFRTHLKKKLKIVNSHKYHSDCEFRDHKKAKSKTAILNKYHNDSEYRNYYKIRSREHFEKTYKCNPIVRSKTIERALKWYHSNNTLMRQKLRQLNNQRRRILKKYTIIQSHKCMIKHRDLYADNVKKFRKIIQEGPDYICIVCRLTFFRNQVIPFVEYKYIREDMSCDIREHILSFFKEMSSVREKWICIACSDKIKKRQMPSRAIVNKLEVCDIPHELKRLNNVEKHLIALRLPFMKIVNLTSGKLSHRLAQKGTKGPLHCVPSDVQDTVTILPRPVDKSMMVRLQLKRRLKYKAVWEEQLINPNDVRDALLVLTKTHPAYENIMINKIDDNYLISDKENIAENDDELDIELIDEDDINNDQNVIDVRKKSTEEHLKSLALGDIDNTVDSDEEIDEDDKDIRMKYNIGTDSCTQPCDFNDFLIFDKEPCIVAPAEKNKLSSLLTDKTIEAMAFPHLFPNGQGSYDEEREKVLKWKEYCKARLFSADSRFAGDSSYIFYLQYLGDLKQVFSGINIAFRKQLPMNVKQTFDESHMKFLMNKDMIYRHLQCVRGSPQYWNKRLKDLFAMTRQLGFPTFFLTLSCADLRWKEFIDTFARHSGITIKETYTFEEKTKLLRANPVLAARLFEKRFNSFMNLFVKGEASCLGNVKDWFARIEMQLRGSPHSHMPIWVECTPKYNGSQTDERTREEIINFCDKYITTRFPSLDDDAELHTIIKEVQTHSRNHSKSCLKYRKTLCRFGFPKPVARRTFICEPLKDDKDSNKEYIKKVKEILTEMNVTMNSLEKEKILLWSDFDNLLNKYNWTYDEYELALRAVHTRTIIIHKRDPNARWVNQYNEELLRVWNANMDIQFVLDPYACAKYLMSYTTKPEREMTLLLEATHKECREGNISVREEMKKLTGTFFNHRQVSVQEAIYRATKMPLTYSSRGFIFVPAHSNSCKFLKPHNILKNMDLDDSNIYMSNMADKYFDRPIEPEFDICMADFASQYEIVSINKKTKNPKTLIKRLQTLNFAIKKRCNRNAIIRFPYFNREIDKENYYENLLCLYLAIRSRNDLKRPYELFYLEGEIYDNRQQCIRKVKDIVYENRIKYEANIKQTNEAESYFNELSLNIKDDEWANIVANKEIDNTFIREIVDEENPDFNLIHKTKNKNIFIDMKQSYFTTNEMRPLLDSMNEEQQEIFYYVRDWCMKRLYNSDVEPLRLFITGGAGTGKSHLLKCLHYEATRIFSRKKHLEPDENIDEIHTLITAFTGAAAVNVSGVTIHSAFGIGTLLNGLSDHLSCDKLNSYRCKLHSLKLLFVDEVSLIQSSLWGAMHSRLTQIMGIHSNAAIFGNIGIIAIGDFYQCSPVAAPSIYSSLLWYDHFEYVELKINERQKSNLSFSQMLNRIRKLNKKEDMTTEDRNMLEKCHQRYLNKDYHSEALHLFAKNAEVDSHNEDMIEKVCVNIRTFYAIDNNHKEIKENESKSINKCKKQLRLAKNARVMITKNICVNDGLANGVTGRIVDYIENSNSQVTHIRIKCDSSKVGRMHRINCPYCDGQDTICVTRESDTNDEQNNDLRVKKGIKQFPLRLSWAMTIHKAQGITVDQVVISTKDFFGSGMGYTALSRVRTLNGLFLIDLHFNKFFCNEKIDKVLSQMKHFKRKQPIFQQGSNYLNILFHNIEGLKCNFNAFRNHYLTKRADLICLTETWINYNNQMNNLDINGYQLINKTRFTSFHNNHQLQSQKRGGIGLYYRDNISIQEFNSNEQLNLEHITFEVIKEKIIIVNCYRSPQQNKKDFLINLIKHLEQIGIEKHIMLMGDFNENSLSDEKKNIEMRLENLGFNNLFKNISTTNSLTSLDCLYCNFKLNQDYYQGVEGTYYSFHDTIVLSINTEFHEKDTNTSSEYDHNENIVLDKTIETTLSTVIVPKKTNKRKYNTTDNISNKMIKKLSNVSTTFNCSNVMMVKQMNFLRNIKNIKGKNFLQVSSNTLTEQLYSIGLKKIKIIGDGNCFFRAISHQLYKNKSKHLEIRLEAVKYIEENKTAFSQFIDEMYITIDNYIEEMSKFGTYADHIVITAAAAIIKKNIIIHEIGKKPLLIPGSDFIDNQLHICYDSTILHYDSVVCVNNDLAIISFQELLIIS